MRDIKDWIKNCEDYCTYPYKDNKDKLKIGWGRNLDDRGISKEEADFLFDNDFMRCERELYSYPWFVNQPTNVQCALLNMCFDLGIIKLLTFKKMIQALIIKDYTNASLEVLDSIWACNVGKRAKDVALMMRQL